MVLGIVTVQLIHKDGTTRSVAMDEEEMKQLSEAAFAAICKCADDMLEGKVFKRVTYMDDEGDLCTLTAVSVSDALGFCDHGGILQLNVESEEERTSTESDINLQVPLQQSASLPVPAPAAAAQERKSSDADSQHFYIGDETQEVESEAVSAAAVALLLKHPDEAVRAATREALRLSAGAVVEERPCTEDEWGKTDDLASKEVLEDSDKEMSSETSEDWEKPDEVEVSLEAEKIGEAPKLKSGKVLCASACLTEPEAMIDCADARGDVTEEFKHLLVQYPDVSQAFRLARLAVSHAGGDGKALVKAVVTNDGAEAWPETCSLRLVAGSSFGFPELPLGPVSPGETVELVLDLSLGAEKGQPGLGQLSAWAVLDEHGAPFGPLLMVEVGYI